MAIQRNYLKSYSYFKKYIKLFFSLQFNDSAINKYSDYDISNFIYYKMIIISTDPFVIPL